MSGSKSKKQIKKSITDGLINGIPIRKIYVAPIKPQVNFCLNIDDKSNLSDAVE